MYAVYNIKNVENKIYLECYDDEVSLAGINSGIIAAELGNILQAEHKPPLGWKLPIKKIYAAKEQKVIIDIKPSSTDEIVLCEIDSIFGFSYENWSPIMMRLRQLHNQDREEGFDKYYFEYPAEENTEVIYTMAYLNGSFKDGELHGTWNWPGKSNTNSVLLWPEAMSYFIKQISRLDKKFIDAVVQEI